MKKLLATLLFSVLFFTTSNLFSQENYSALNFNVKFGDNSGIAAHYEIPVAKNFTLSPSTAFSFDFDYIALGARADYYFDDLLNLNGPWDLWAGADTGFVVGDDKDQYDNFDINFHAGIEYKFNDTWGIIGELGGGTDLFGKIGFGIHL